MVGGFVGWWYVSQNSLKNDTKETVAQKKEIKKLTIATVDGPLDSFFPDTGEISDYHYIINSQVAEGLVAYENQTDIVPRLASTWTNPDELTWRFNLKKGVKFHTGKTMTADDVVYSINLAKKFEERDIYVGTIDSIKVISPYVVEIKTKEPYAVLLNKLTLVHIVDSKTVPATNTLTGGTGPYIVKPNTTPSENQLDLVAFDDYHGGRPLTRALSFRVVDSEDAAIEAVRSGKTNIGGEITSEGLQKIDKMIQKSKEFQAMQSAFWRLIR